MLEGFFGGYVEELTRMQFPDIYLVYSGGDDLVAVGPWDQAIDFILKLRDEFGRFVCRNPNWGFSAGVYIGNPQTPLLSAVEAAEENLKASKHREGKDCITLFATTLNWEEAASARELGERLAAWIIDKVLSTSQIRRLQTYGLMHAEYLKTQDTSHLRYAYLLAYDIKRNWGEKNDGQKRPKSGCRNSQIRNTTDSAIS